jgi:hypothetical protein
MNIGQLNDMRLSDLIIFYAYNSQLGLCLSFKFISVYANTSQIELAINFLFSFIQFIKFSICLKASNIFLTFSDIHAQFCIVLASLEQLEL